MRNCALIHPLHLELETALNKIIQTDQINRPIHPVWPVSLDPHISRQRNYAHIEEPPGESVKCKVTQ